VPFTKAVALLLKRASNPPSKVTSHRSLKMLINSAFLWPGARLLVHIQYGEKRTN